MQTLQNLVRNLALILLVATFLEMLLPNKSMRGFVQMVMGLFVISAVLAPISTLLHTPLSMEIPAWSEAAPQDLPVIAEEQGVKAGRNAVQEQYRQILVNQIEALALSTKGVESASVDIKFADGTGGVADQPKISAIDVTLTAAKEEIEPVQPITIGPKPQAPQQSPKSDEVRDKISVFMSLPKEAIHVQER
ncbi:stage III sporulation protein AF [Desulfosporosinus sp. PR]|uniref:stage III sporulation protein AF n=1 Tax=Candidatus Desulfosporosinus nitrosoreducens TaxID=3401928 RepID=UPI0027E87875|nr:stage III sporulation protein AF [Desulfosporosinus sp. PR]MDQ7095783.1 stage III sporulation protein AF [Desulfosporosinus sp. PR]